ncbi:hypothetical protein [Gottfriedia acidiceleris]|uniref:hypothetical protein n=1 Tax=Gottfriedia acidiceleris TaxID=371036 RepID=UPI002FFF079B
MSIDFCIADTINEAAKSSRYVAFEEEVHEFLIKEEKFYVRKKNKESKNLDLLLGLDPYGDKIFNDQEIKELIRICEYIIYNFKNDFNELYIISVELKELCLNALDKGKQIVAVGD